MKKIFAFLLFFCLINLNVVFSEENFYKKLDSNNQDWFKTFDFTGYFITIGILLVALVALAIVSNKLKNRNGSGTLPKLSFGLNNNERKKRIKILEKHMLEPRKSLYIVNIDEKDLLLGTSDNNINLISELDSKNDQNNPNEEKEKKNKGLDKEKNNKKFSDYLKFQYLVPIFILLSLIIAIPVFAQISPSETTKFLDSIDLRSPAKLKDLSTPIQLIIFMSFLTLLPFFIIMTTSFMRTIIVLGFLRQAIGTQQIPPNQVILGITIFMTVFIMSPVWQEVSDKALVPYLDNKISQSVAFDRGIKPIRNFMLKYTRKEELAFFMKVVKLPQPKTAKDVPIHVLIPAFMVSELGTGFKIGFFLFLPFLVVDLVVANTLLALGMMMLSPVTISMPFKLLVFTLANGWFLVLQALVTTFKL